MKKHSMRSASKVAQQATNDITKFLKNQSATISIQNVEMDRRYQLKDIDLIWTYQKNGKRITRTIEIKGDRYHRTGNYFFETISNLNKQSLGCFLYTEADYIFYYFVQTQQLHILPTKRVRAWFLKYIHHFREQATSTPVGNGEAYITIGRLVSIQMASQMNLGIRVLDLSAYIK